MCQSKCLVVMVNSIFQFTQKDMSVSQITVSSSFSSFVTELLSDSQALFIKKKRRSESEKVQLQERKGKKELGENGGYKWEWKWWHLKGEKEKREKGSGSRSKWLQFKDAEEWKGRKSSSYLRVKSNCIFEITEKVVNVAQVSESSSLRRLVSHLSHKEQIFPVSNKKKTHQ